MPNKSAAVWAWLTGPRHVWLAALVVMLALAVAFGPTTTEPTIRLVGLSLQVMGILTVIWGISETRKLFGHPSIASKIRAYIEAFPLLRRPVITGVGTGSIGVIGGKARAYATHGAGPNPTIGARLDALEKNIAGLHERVSEVEREMDSEFQKASAALKNEEEVRAAEDREIRDKLEATGTGGVHISAIGVLWLLVGVVLSTASVELSRLCQ